MSIDINAVLRDVAERSDRVRLADAATVRRAGERRARRRQFQVAAAVAFIVALGVALARGPLDPRADQPPVGPVPIPSPTATSTVGTNEGGPTVHAIETGPYRFSAHAIAVHDGRFVVVGDSSDFEEPGPPVYWSEDAVRWQSPPPGGAPDSQNVTDVIATKSGFLAVGVNVGGPAAWRSADGRTWVRSQVDAPGRGRTDALWGVTSTAQGYFAWGFDGGHAGLWRSPDGTSWTQAGDQRVFDLPQSESICAVREVRGGLMAVGVVAPRNSREGQRVVWSSTNGSDWVLSRGHGEPMIWCDPPDVLHHLEASSASVGKVRIDPYGEGNEVEVSVRQP